MSVNTNDTELISSTIHKIFTLEDVHVIAQSISNNKSFRVLRYEIENYSKFKLGFSGDHSKLKITLKRSNESQPETFNFFVKSVPYTCKEQTELLQKRGVYSTESGFFETILPRLLQSCESEKWYPACYLAKKDAIVLEDLRLQDFKEFETFFDNFAALKSAFASVARFHSCSILEEARLSENSESPVTLDLRYPTILQEKLFIETEPVNWIEGGIDVACAIGQTLGLDVDKIRKAFGSMCDMVKPSKTHRNVICHGDLWKNNLMFADDSPLQKCILIDYQLIRYAPLVLDLLNLLHLSATEKFRDEYEVELITFYHSVLEETVKKNGSIKNANVPSLDEIFAGMNDLRTYGLVLAVMYFPIVLLNPKVVAECVKDSRDQFLLNDRVELTLAQMEQDKWFKKKVEEAVVQLVEKIK